MKSYAFVSVPIYYQQLLCAGDSKLVATGRGLDSCWDIVTHDPLFNVSVRPRLVKLWVVLSKTYKEMNERMTGMKDRMSEWVKEELGMNGWVNEWESE